MRYPVWRFMVMIVVLWVIHPTNFFAPGRKNITYEKPVYPSETLVSINNQENSGNLLLNRIFLPGETLASVLSEYRVPPPEQARIAELLRPYKNPRGLSVGDSLLISLQGPEANFAGLEYFANGHRIRIEKAPEGSWVVHQTTLPVQVVPHVFHGEINKNFYQSGIEAGLDPKRILEISDIFQYDVDFFADMRDGDQFWVYLEDRVYGREHLEPGNILGARLMVQGRIYDAFYFRSLSGTEGYYDREGRPLKKMFLRAPLNYRRISSFFSYHRFHPILRKVRAHLAIDYKAAAGTPLVSIGNGVVLEAGRHRGYGNFISIRHPNGYVSRYAHLSRFARGIRKGAHVSQGQVIGYVGSTGLATGPHLHFEIQKNGRNVNFLMLKNPPQEPLRGDLLQAFLKERDKVLAGLTQDLHAETKRSTGEVRE